jgi:RNA polymerase sigma factor (sigma-70 family)
MRLAEIKRILTRPIGPGHAVATVGATGVAVPGAMPGASPMVWEGEFLHERQREFGSIYERLYDRLVHHAMRFVGRVEAEDAVHDAMFSLWQRWATLPPEQRTDAYIFAAVKLRARTIRNQNRRTVELDEADDVLDDQAVALFEAGRRYADIADALDSVIRSMSARRREVILFVYEEQFTYEEAAEAMGISFNSVKTHLRLAIADLRAAYDRAGFRIEHHDIPRLSAPKGDQTHA